MGGGGVAGPDLNDSRFSEMFTSSDFALDPTDPRYVGDHVWVCVWGYVPSGPPPASHSSVPPYHHTRTSFFCASPPSSHSPVHPDPLLSLFHAPPPTLISLFRAVMLRKWKDPGEVAEREVSHSFFAPPHTHSFTLLGSRSRRVRGRWRGRSPASVARSVQAQAPLRLRANRWPPRLPHALQVSSCRAMVPAVAQDDGGCSTGR